MAANGTVELEWGDGPHSFCLAKMGQVLELEERCNAGIMEVLKRLQGQRWRYMDVREPIRLGLIGGGKSPPAALALVRRYVEERPLEESALVAMVIVSAAVVGVPGDQPGKALAGLAKTELSNSTTKTDGLSGPQSTG
jgi:hypothetical protein